MAPSCGLLAPPHPHSPLLSLVLQLALKDADRTIELQPDSPLGYACRADACYLVPPPLPSLLPGLPWILPAYQPFTILLIAVWMVGTSNSPPADGVLARGPSSGCCLECRWAASRGADAASGCAAVGAVRCGPRGLLEWPASGPHPVRHTFPHHLSIGKVCFCYRSARLFIFGRILFT